MLRIVINTPIADKFKMFKNTLYDKQLQNTDFYTAYVKYFSPFSSNVKAELRLRCTILNFSYFSNFAYDGAEGFALP